MLPSPTGPCQTSSRSLVFGLGPSITSEDGIITGAKLPTGRQILRCMLAKKPGGNGALSAVRGNQGCPGAGAAILQESQHPNAQGEAARGASAAAAARQSRCEKELEEITAMSSLVSESDEEPEEDANRHRQHRPTLTDNFPLAIITSQSQENCPSKQSISSASEGSAVQH
ncbi:hypothetical protein KUCAC02_008052 [Chaenocephalus aceratus]|uniref:Uncharacterized protein n=1 Tax=Chaenocephalus aceratus TaxID=36190 RepID=A0ACB9X950_CHAAC|nr:hypothetical protein KUCAC02_008052 [Chaenocephalus aceratus]